MAFRRPNGARVANHHALAALVEHPLQVGFHLAVGLARNVDQLRLRVEITDRSIGVLQGLAEHGHFLAEWLIGRQELEVVAQAALRDGKAVESATPRIEPLANPRLNREVIDVADHVGVLDLAGAEDRASGGVE